LPQVPFDTLLVTGPMMDTGLRESLHTMAEGLPVRVTAYIEDSLSVFNAADLVVTMAGYNSLTEAVSLKQRVLVIPREGPGAEQRMRAELFAKHRLVTVLRAEQLSAPRLARAIQTALGAPPPPAAAAGALPTNGLQETIRAIDALLMPARRRRATGGSRRNVPRRPVA
jgi:predicted glycosyltransferase